jgi:uncharacterized protein
VPPRYRSSVGVVVQEVDVPNTSRDQPPSLGGTQPSGPILEIAQRHGVLESVARGDANSGSDVDLLVELEPGRSLFDLGGLLMDLRDLLEGPVDVVTPAALQQRVRITVLREAVPL